MNEVTNTWVPKNVGNFFTSRVTVGLLRRTLLCGVGQVFVCLINNTLFHRHLFVKDSTFAFGDRGGVAQWLSCCATNRKVTGSIPAGVIGIFH